MQVKSVAVLLISTAATVVAQDIASITPPPSSILSVLETAVPTSLLLEFASDPSAFSSYVSAIAAGSTPAWYSSLPSSVKSYLVTAYGTIIASDTPSAQAAGASASSSAGSQSTSASTGGAPAATGVLAMGIAGAAGILGLAVAL